MIERLASLGSFPAFTLSELIVAAAKSGAPLQSGRISAVDFAIAPRPFLALLEGVANSSGPLVLIAVYDVIGRHIVIDRNQFGSTTISREKFLKHWTGGMLYCRSDGNSLQNECPEIKNYRDEVKVIERVLTKNECAEIIRYAEDVGFRRSKVLTQLADRYIDEYSLKHRSSSSTTLSDRNQSILNKLYEFCAEAEGVPLTHIETIQCVRYKNSQKFQRHHDASTKLPRMITYLFYLNDEFDGGETYFPICDLVIKPKTGACLRFISGDESGRTAWVSDHGGLPVKNGTKYALNIWIRSRPCDK